jgi:hypothetical protein
MCLALIPKESTVPTASGAINPWLAGDRVSNGLIQSLSASGALLGDAKPQAVDVGKFRWREDHVPPPLVLSSWVGLRGDCEFCLHFDVVIETDFGEPDRFFGTKWNQLRLSVVLSD